MINDCLTRIRDEVKSVSDLTIAESGKRFFKDEDHFLSYGLRSSEVNRIINLYAEEIKGFSKHEVLELCENLWQSGYQEEASIACAFSEKLAYKSESADFDIYTGWLNHYVRNWAMCDTFCNHTIGDLVIKYPELAEQLLEWTQSDNRWVKRGSAVTLIIPARSGLFLPLVFRIADELLLDADNMVQKGYGWMLKATSEAHEQEVFDFVMHRRTTMPRTALRYAIEKMPKDKRKLAMSKGEQ